MSSRGGGRGGDIPDCVEMESDDSPRPVISVRLGNLSGPIANGHSLLLRRHLGCEERISEVGQGSPIHLEKTFQEESIQKRQVAADGSGFVEHKEQVGEKGLSQPDKSPECDGHVVAQEGMSEQARDVMEACEES